MKRIIELLLFVVVMAGFTTETLGDVSCTGGQVYTTCGSCDRLCDSPEPFRCTAVCRRKCQCPNDKPVLHNGQCIVKSNCPVKLTCTSCSESYSPMPACVRRIQKQCRNCRSSWFRRRCSYYDCSYNQKTCSCPGYRLVGNVCQTECGGCVNTAVTDQQACLHKAKSDKPYCCDGFYLEHVNGKARCKKGACRGGVAVGVPLA